MYKLESVAQCIDAAAHRWGGRTLTVEERAAVDKLIDTVNAEIKNDAVLDRIFSDLRDAEREVEQAPAVSVEDGCILLGGYYGISLAHIDTHAKILMWVLHLIGKVWVTKAMLRHLILTACDESNLPPPQEVSDADPIPDQGPTPSA